MIDEKTVLFAKTKEKKLEEQTRGYEAWGIIGRGPVEYAKSFGLPIEYFTEFVSNRRIKGLNTFGLDLFSTTDFLEKLGIEGIAVGLSDLRSRERRQEDKNKRIQISGDLYKDRKRIWQDITKILRDRSLTGVDLVTENAVAGFGHVPRYPKFFVWHLEQIWHNLNLNGQIVAKLPWSLVESFYDDEIVTAWQKAGVNATVTDSHTLIIEKTKSSPESIILNSFPLNLSQPWEKAFY